MLLPPYTRTGDSNSLEKQVDNPMTSTLNFNNKQAVFATQTTDYGQPIACISYPYGDPGSGGVWAAYGSHAVLHSQIAGGTSARVPLPLEPAEDEPIYVNPKQYHGILRRRQLRAKLEAQNKLVKARKPYLHESRHRHAMKRARGSGGRFLNTKQLHQQQQSSCQASSSTDATNVSGSTHLQLGGGAGTARTGLSLKTLRSEENISKAASSSVPAFSHPPSMPKDDAFFQHHSHHHHHHLDFFGHHFGQGSMQGAAGVMHAGNHQRVPVMR